MADYPWHDRIRAGGILRLRAGTGFIGTAWGRALTAGVTAFNALMTTNHIALQAQVVTDDPVHITLQTAARMLPGGGTFDGNGLHGLARKTMEGPERGGASTLRVTSCIVFVPATPRGTRRGVGAPVMEMILVHELIHAAGLGDHASDGVFASPMDYHEGRTAAADRVQPWGGVGRPMPPPYLIGATTERLIAIWARRQSP